MGYFLLLLPSVSSFGSVTSVELGFSGSMADVVLEFSGSGVVRSDSLESCSGRCISTSGVCLRKCTSQTLLTVCDEGMYTK